MVADRKTGIGVGVADILGWPAEHRAALNVVVFADADMTAGMPYTRVRLDERAAADLDSTLDQTIRSNLRVFGDRRRIGHYRRGMDAQIRSRN